MIDGGDGGVRGRERQFGANAGKDIPEGPKQRHDEGVAEGPKEDLVEDAVLFRKLLAGRAAAFHRRDEGVEPGELLRGVFGGDVGNQSAFQDEPDLKQFPDGLDILRDIDPDPKVEAIDEGIEREDADVGAGAVPRFDDAEGPEGLHCLSQRRATDAERAGEIGLGEERITGAEAAFDAEPREAVLNATMEGVAALRWCFGDHRATSPALRRKPESVLGSAKQVVRRLRTSSIIGQVGSGRKRVTGMDWPAVLSGPETTMMLDLGGREESLRGRRGQPKSEMDDVVVEGKGFGDTEPFHHGEADGIDEAERLVAILMDDRASAGPVVDGGANHLGRTVVDAVQNLSRPVSPLPG